MKTIEVDEELYLYIASRTLHIGESASDILRRLLNVDGTDLSALSAEDAFPAADAEIESHAVQPEPSSPVVRNSAEQLHAVDSVKAMRELLISDEFAAQKKVVDRFILVLSTLYRLNPSSFSDAMSVKGRKRQYFADNEQTLLNSGTTTKPKAIPDTPFWVITNNNTSRKQQMVDQVMTLMEFPTDIIEKVTHSL